ncbi:energy-coupling factor transporter transmembrane component T [Bacillus tianshenii]|nr:energy-coupling factor transporter transmembrane component T [Bacillus tianshenii]
MAGFAGVHPFVSFSFYMGVLLFSMLFFHPIFLGASLLAVILLNLCHDKGEKLKQFFVAYLLMGLFVLIVNPLLTHRGSHILFYLFDQPITLEAVSYGVTMGLLLWTILICFLSFNFVITANKFLYLFSSILPKTSLLLMMSFRFVPLLKRRLEQISTVQQTRGIDLRVGSLRKRAQDGMQLMHILLTWSLDEAIQTADSMKARGYGVKTERTSYVSFQIEKRDKVLLGWMMITFVICLWGWWQGYGRAQFYPVIDVSALLQVEWHVFSIYCLYLSMPIFIELKERLWWSRLK